MYARRCPCREMEGSIDSSLPTSSRWELPPETGILHKAEVPVRFDEKTISRPSSVQVGPVQNTSSPKVRRRGSPPETGTTYRSSPEPLSVAEPRTNARVCPSGEKAGPSSKRSAGGDVSSRFWSVSSESRKMAQPREGWFL